MKSTLGFLRLAAVFGALCVSFVPHVGAVNFVFNTDPFAGSTALTTPGRQIVAGESFITFNPAADVFVIDPATFGVGGAVSFANGAAAGLATSGLNAIVLEEFPATLAAGTAADLIAARITAPGAGFFIYFNTGLDVARLVFSTDLNDNTADLKIVARMTNLSGQPGRDALASITAANFQITPTPQVSDTGGMAAILFLAGGAMLVARRAIRRFR